MHFDVSQRIGKAVRIRHVPNAVWGIVEALPTGTNGSGKGFWQDEPKSEDRPEEFIAVRGQHLAFVIHEGD